MSWQQEGSVDTDVGRTSDYIAPNQKVEPEEFFFVLVVPCIINLFYVRNQRDAVLSSLFIVLQNHSTCFGCPLRPSSGVHKTAVTTTGTSHVYQ